MGRSSSKKRSETKATTRNIILGSGDIKIASNAGSGFYFKKASLKAIDRLKEKIVEIQAQAEKENKKGVVQGDFSGSNLENIDLSQIDFKGSLFKKTKGHRVTFGDESKIEKASSLEGCDMSYSFFHKSRFSQVSLKNANLEGAKISASNFYKSHLKGANLKGAELSSCIFSYLDPEDLDCQFDENTQFWGSSFLNSIGPFPAKANLDHVNFLSTKFNEVIFSGNISFIGADFFESEWNRARVPSANFTKSNFSISKIKDSDFTFSQFKKADLSHGEISGSVFFEADFTDADLSYIEAKDCDFSRALFKGADFTGAEFIRCKFDQVTISPAIKAKARFIDCDFGGHPF